MKVIIVYGFLGAGKTTLIRHLLDTMVEPGKVAVLVNDFGRVNVDGATLAGQHLKVMPMASGCICCTLSGAFTPALEELHTQWNPEWLVIEPTGVAAPYALEALIRGERLAKIATLERVVTVIDANRFLDYRPKLGEFYSAQIEQADLILLNKADLANPDWMAATASAIRALNPRAHMRITHYSQMDWHEILGDGPTEAVSDRHVHVPDFETCDVPLGPMTLAELDQLFEAVRGGRFGRVYRAKGIASVDGMHMLVNYADGDLSVEPTVSSLSDLVVVGQGLDASRLRQWHRVRDS